MSKKATPVQDKGEESEHDDEEKKLAKFGKEELDEIADDDEEDLRVLKAVSLPVI